VEGLDAFHVEIIHEAELAFAVVAFPMVALVVVECDVLACLDAFF
tara:strand:- start:201 stop:335 length:135 start_codon:yes stop_codon:yes gene_type:complete